MSAIGPGDWVECVKQPIETHPLMITVKVGGLYCVSCFDTEDSKCPTCGNTGFGIYLVGDTPNDDQARCPCRYRLVYRPRADLIKTLLQPVDGVSPELETA